jgi:hypothetical protein
MTDQELRNRILEKLYDERHKPNGGAKGDTTFTFLGNTFTSNNVGLVAVALGSLLVGLTFRPILTSVERLRG